jgi:hypothetical protein
MYTVNTAAAVSPAGRNAADSRPDTTMRDAMGLRREITNAVSFFQYAKTFESK